MSSGRRLAIVAAAGLAAVVLFVVLRPEADPQIPPSTTARAQPQRAVEALRPQAQLITVRIRQGRVQGGVRRVEVKTGRRVTLVVHADVADHVHVHGYNLTRDVGPGKPARLLFRADLTGRFEVELEQHRLPILELEVLP